MAFKLLLQSGTLLPVILLGNNIWSAAARLRWTAGFVAESIFRSIDCTLIWRSSLSMIKLLQAFLCIQIGEQRKHVCECFISFNDPFRHVHTEMWIPGFANWEPAVSKSRPRTPFAVCTSADALGTWEPLKCLIFGIQSGGPVRSR
jgi:hypothetical protein